MTTLNCDRCGKEFEQPQKHNEYFIGKIGKQDGSNIPVNEQDICPKCYKAFLNWWKK